MVSVVIPTHNRSELLKRAINSVLQQTYVDFELIVVSDGSTDDTEMVMKQYTDNDIRIKFIHYPNAQGANHARNTGIHECKGDFVAFLDDDDEWYPNKLQCQLQLFLEDETIGLVYSGIDIVYQDRTLHYYSIPNDTGDLHKEILFRNCITTTSSVIVRKKVLEEVGGFDENLPAKQDYDLWIRCLQITHVDCVKKPLLNYYLSYNSNQISSHTEKYVRASDIIDKKYRDLFATLSNKEQKKREAIKYSDLAKIALRNRNGKECRRFCKISLLNKIGLSSMAVYMASFFNYDFIMRIMQFVRKG